MSDTNNIGLKTYKIPRGHIEVLVYVRAISNTSIYNAYLALHMYWQVHPKAIHITKSICPESKQL
jgi:hypothetical protein